MKGCLYLVVFVVFLVCSACATKPQGDLGPKRSPLEEALLKATDARGQALSDAIEESETQRSYSVLVRYNPGRCGAPDQEIFVHGRWERVALTGKNDRIEISLQEWIDSARQEPLIRTRMNGQWDERVWSSPGGVQWPVFEIAEVEAGLVAQASEATRPEPLAQRSSFESGINDGEWLTARCAGAGSRSTP